MVSELPVGKTAKPTLNCFGPDLSGPFSSLLFVTFESVLATFLRRGHCKGSGTTLDLRWLCDVNLKIYVGNALVQLDIFKLGTVESDRIVEAKLDQDCIGVGQHCVRFSRGIFFSTKSN